jgi:hypothetical protein
MPNVTFILSIPGETIESHDTFYISGTFSGWGASNAMTFNSSDITHSITVSFPLLETIEYKFHTNNWVVSDTFNASLSTGKSLHTMKTGKYSNRLIVFTESYDITVYAELNNPQSRVGNTNVTFILSIPGETIESHDTFYVSGTFSGWDCNN